MADGDPTDAPPEGSANIASHLRAMAALQPHSPALFFPDGSDRRGRVRYTHLTYAQLSQTALRVARGLGAHGVTPGTRVALMVKPSLELFSLVFGLFEAGVVPVMVDPGIGLKNMKSCLARARPQAFIGIPTAHLARLALGWARSSVKTVITVGRRGPWGGVTLDDLERLGRDARALPEQTSDDEAAILFTSGSTGPPKGAVYTHGNFSAQVHAIRRMYAIEPGEIDLPTFPLFALFDPALGMTTILPDMDPTRPAKADPVKIARAIEDFGVTNMFGSPALLNTLSRWAERERRTLPTLRRVISAGAPVPTAVLRRVRKMIHPDGFVVTPYGATECLPVASIESREVLEETAAQTARGAGVCVGRPVEEADVTVIAIDDRPLARASDATPVEQGTIGEITVRGPQATRRYWEAEEHTALAKILDDEPADGGSEGFRHRMGDLGYFDERGRLWFCGRKSQRVEHEGQTLFTTACEGVFDAHPDVFRSALVRAEGRGAVVCVELEPLAQGHDEAVLGELRELAKHHERTRSLSTFLVHPSFPVDIRHNAKIKREELGRWATEELSR